jgi:hypothetical protein
LRGLPLEAGIDNMAGHVGQRGLQKQL